MTQPLTAGPNRDGSKSLARESRYGFAASFVATLLITAGLGWLADLDLSSVPGWAAGAVAYAAATLTGLGTAYVTKNRKPVQ